MNKNEFKRSAKTDPVRILNKKNASKEELRNALAEVLGLPCPDFGQTLTEIQQMRLIWSEFFMQQTGTEYQYAVKDNKAMKDLEQKINNVLQNNGSLIDAWRAMLHNLPDFYRTKALTLTAINGGFNAIVASIKKASHEKTGITQDYAARIAAALRED